MKNQYRWKGITQAPPWPMITPPGPWYDTKSRAILDALENGATGKDEEIEMRSVPCGEPNYAASFGGDEE